MNQVSGAKTVEDNLHSPNRNLHSKLVSGVVSLSGSQVVRRGCRSLFLLLAARKLGPEIFGIYILLLTVTELLALISGTGFGDYLTREVAKAPESAYQLLFRITQLRLVYLLILAAVAIPILQVLKYSSQVLVNEVLLSLTLFPRALSESSQGIMRARKRFSFVFWVELLQGTILLAFGSLLVVRGLGLRGIIWAELASVVAGAGFAFPVALCLSPDRIKDSSTWRQRIRETFTFNLYPLIGNTYDRVDVILLSKFVGNAAVGVYGLPYRAYTALSILPSGIMGTLLPTLARSTWGHDEKKRCAVTMQWLYAAALFLVLATSLVATDLVRIVLGPAYGQSAPVLKLLSWAAIPMFLNYALNTFLLAKNQERVFIRTASVCTIVNVAANLLLIPRYSYFAAAAVTIVTELVLFGQNLVLLRKSLGFVPLPARLLPNSVGFIAILIAASQAARFIFAPLLEAVAIVAFGAYLYAANQMSFFGHRAQRARSSIYGG